MNKSLSEACVFVNSLSRRLSILIVAAVAFNANAAGNCDEIFSECREDCTLEFGGSIRDSVKAHHIECMKKCTKKLNLCAERRRETKASKLDDDALTRPETAKKKKQPESTRPTLAEPKPDVPKTPVVEKPSENNADDFDDLKSH